MCSQILPCVLQSRIQIHPIIGPHKWRTFVTNTDLSNNLNLQPENCNSLATYHQALPLFDIKKHIQKILHGQNPEPFDEADKFMSMFNDERKAIQKPVCMIPK